MIKIENVDVFGFESAIRGMRNPMNSWDKSDSERCEFTNCNSCTNYTYCNANENTIDYVIGIKDLKLMQSLVKAGTDHSKFMRMINVTLDITAPLYWWKEFDTYKVGTVRNSCSTMHKIHSKEFTLDDFSHEHLILWDVDNNVHVPMGCLQDTINVLNACREKYLETKDKLYWWQMIQLLPSSYNQRATVQLNYAVLRNMYHGRNKHPIDDWSVEFCKWVESLPYAEELICSE